jgi:general secretion pathway protein A
VIGDRALMAGFAREQESLGERLIDRAADETLPGHARYWLHRYGRWAAAAALLIAAGIAAQYLLQRPPQPPAQAAIVPPPAPPRDETLAQLRDAIVHGQDSELTAWTQLLARWQVNSSQVSVRDAARCQNIVFPGLDCLHGSGTIEQLARFDRPLILMLHQDSVQADALLQDVDAQHVRLNVDGTSRLIEKKDLSTIWSGEFSAVWQVPAEVPATLRLGDAGAGVAWIKAQLARMDGGKSAETGPAYFDAALEERVRKLQIAYGIKPDGIVGPETLFALSALDESGPHLFHNIEL